MKSKKNIWFEFIEGPVSQQLISDAEQNTDKSSGAVVSFRGYVRDDTIGDSRVQSIEFSAHKEIAHNEATAILKQIIAKYKLHTARIIHSLGIIDAGKVCFFVKVSSGHRKEAFRAIEEIVDVFKEKVPVFGKEILANGKYAWKENK
ncbi:MAG: molybdenum cofactor biosynthesis protein MoaE [Bacteroidales bacterium]|nr:molybdenum cofactor biosynthesis protein MoaE [Bacteroidales bacterium]MBN2818399.1 molybdenum cofactor biosynthesis protein MoaE [Bacteroidales bacterium]